MNGKFVYLAGPISGCTDSEAHDWRELVKTKLGSDRCLDPMCRDFRGRIETDEDVRFIIDNDKADIDRASVILVNAWKPGWGTGMEILHAWERRKPLVIVVPPDKTVSPWLRYHGLVVRTVNEAVELVRGLIN